MKSFLAPAFGSMAACALLLFSSGIQAQTTIHAEGVISDYGPEALVISSGTQTVPLRYSATPDTIYVDEAGNPVSIETVRSGLPVTIYSYRDGDRVIASRVVVRRAATAPVVVPETRVRTETTTTVIPLDDDDDDDE